MADESERRANSEGAQGDQPGVEYHPPQGASGGRAVGAEPLVTEGRLGSGEGEAAADRADPAQDAGRANRGVLGAVCLDVAPGPFVERCLLPVGHEGPHENATRAWLHVGPTIDPPIPGQDACTCSHIQAADPSRHFKGCPFRKPLAVAATGPDSAVLIELEEALQIIAADCEALASWCDILDGRGVDGGQPRRGARTMRAAASVARTKAQTIRGLK